MENKIYLKNIPSFGVAGNFTGHLEQAGEDKDFLTIKTESQNAPKAVFPTYINVNKSDTVPAYLQTFPFDSTKINFPKNEQKIQIEPECALIFDAIWENEKLIELKAVNFGASNDCSIRKEGAKKISVKKNWGNSSKGFSSNLIPVDSFTKDGLISKYKIASFLIRDNQIYDYGEDSFINDYSYIYEKLISWLIEKFNFQKDEGPAENIYSYLKEAGFPKQIMVSIGATRYTDWGETNFLKEKDEAVVAVYPSDKYSYDELKSLVLNHDYSDKSVSFLSQVIHS